MEKERFRVNCTSRSTSYLALIWFVLLLWGCAPTTTSDPGTSGETSDTPTSESPSGPGHAIATAALPKAPQVIISVDARSLPQERLQVFEEEGGAESLIQGISGEITKKGKQFGPEPTEIRVKITRFRLRSTATSVWFGMMAGADILDVRVIVVANGQTKKTFDTGVGGAVGGLIKPTAEGRFDGLVEVVSERIVQDL